MRKEFSLAGGVDRSRHRPDAGGAEPEVHPLRARSGEQRNRFTAGDYEIGEYVGRRARPVPHLRERDRSSGDRHHHAVAVLAGAVVEYRRDAEAFDTERGWV